MTTDLLNTLVSSAIWRAEQLEEQGFASAPLAWGEVSELEEKLATVLPVSQPEGRIARRGAVRAALKAQNYNRALALAQQYIADKEAPKSLRVALREILEEDAQTLASRFPHAAKLDVVDDARDLARHLQQNGAFGLAA